MEETSYNNKVLNISAISKGRRILLFLSDSVLCLFLSFLLMNILVFPVSKAISNYSYDQERLKQSETSRYDILYSHNLLFYTEGSKYYFDVNIQSTFRFYLSSFIPNSFVSKEDSEIFKNYFVSIKSDFSSYLDLYRKFDEPFGFFDISDSGIDLKEQYKSEFIEYFDPKAELGEATKNSIDKLQDSFFLNGYHAMIEDINFNDLTITKDGEVISYIESYQKVKDIDYKNTLRLTISSYISFFLSFIIYFYLIPRLNRKKKTISMMILHYERVSIKDFRLLKKSEMMLSLPYELGLNIGSTLFLPYPHVSFATLFSFNTIVPISVVSFGFVLISLVVLLISSFSRSLKDYMTRSFLVSSDTLDEVYRLKGYSHD